MNVLPMIKRELGEQARSPYHSTGRETVFAAAVGVRT
jgi:hypothetical protein